MDERFNNVQQSFFSIRRMVMERPSCKIKKCLAATEKLHKSQNAIKYLNWRISILIVSLLLN